LKHALCQWCCNYIREQKERIYVRQIPLEGIHTKFVESNKSVLAAWLDFLCPENLWNHESSRSSDFAKRYGFLDKPQQVRVRILDPDYYLHGLSDWTLIATELAKHELPIQNGFICENNVTCLSFPQVSWLHTKQIFYWGGLDTNGKWGDNVRLEQELIPMSYVKATLAKMG
jgi:hypothetical protein